MYDAVQGITWMSEHDARLIHSDDIPDGAIFLDTNSDTLKAWNGTRWVDMGVNPCAEVYLGEEPQICTLGRPEEPTEHFDEELFEI